MRKFGIGLATACLLAGCTVLPAPSTATPGGTSPSASSASSPSATATASASAAPSGTATASASASPSPSSPTADASDSLAAAFAHPESGGIAAFLRKNRDYLPAMVIIGDEVASGSAKGPLELGLKNIPAGTTRIYMTIACTESKAYRMELTRDDNSAVGASWGDSCGYWGGLNGYATSAFSDPPTRFVITVGPDVRYSYVLYASPGK